MEKSDIGPALVAAKALATSLGLRADDAVVLQAANRLTLRLLPANVVARVALVTHRAGDEFELAIAELLAETDGPVAGPDPRVSPQAYVRDPFVVTLWTYYEPVPDPPVSPAEFGEALSALHAGMRTVDVSAPHFMDRVSEARRIVENSDLSPELADHDRVLLIRALRVLPESILRGGSPEQLLHGEPSPGQLASDRNWFPIHRFRDLLPWARRV